jgi:hypothetical protein
MPALHNIIPKRPQHRTKDERAKPPPTPVEAAPVQRFGRLIVLSIDATGKRSVCSCDCGNIRQFSVEAIRDGAIRSCGCGLKSQQPGAAAPTALPDWRPGR